MKLSKPVFIAFIFLAACSNAGQHPANPAIAGNELQEGDIVFQTSLSNQSQAIQLATKSRYSHMGVLYKQDGKFQVYEAVQPVKLTPFDEWVKRGENGHYAVKRLKNADQVLTSEVLNKMKETGKLYMGRDYDIYFEWSDDKIYCSELVWKIYRQGAGIEIGRLQELKDFDLSSDMVRGQMRQRYGSKIPLHEQVISPAAMFEFDQLVTVKVN